MGEELSRPGGRRVALVELTGARDMGKALRELEDEHGSVAPVDLEPGVPGWLVLGHAEVAQVMRLETVFARDPRHWRWYHEGRLLADSVLLPILSPGGREAMYYKDGPEHRRLRTPVDDVLGEFDETTTAAMVRAVADGLIEQFAGRGRAELISEYTVAMSFLSVAAMFGFRRQEGLALMHCALEIFGHGGSAAVGLRTLDRLVLDHVVELRAAPGADLTSKLIRHGGLRDDTEVAHTIVVAICAALEMLVSWSAAALRLMLTDPRFTGRVVGARRGLDDAVDEVLWREPPVAALPARYAVGDWLLGDRMIREGDALVMSLAAANTDPRVHPDAEFDAGNRSHLSFGLGAHSCPARRQARLVVRIAVERLVQRLDLRLVDDDVTWAPSPWSRYPAAMRVEFTPVG
ncbi:cytochrome P450 [Myceligenerans crystallogenes]|uniref:Cytochrome P450 n=1 Tax=Myceligenerans crystallogenes TaxID=316335 RepID=A0ABN2N9S8_9MICO